MSETAESPGAEVQQGKKRRSWCDMLLCLLVAGLIYLFLSFLPSFTGHVLILYSDFNGSFEGETSASIKTLEINMFRYKTMMGRFPGSLQDFVSKPANGPDIWRRLMRKEALLDPWGEPYQYRNPGIKNPNGYDLFSKGPDKKEGTPDDIGNW